MATYYNDAGKKLTGTALKKYLAALKKADQTGKPYTGKTYYTKDQLEQKYNGFDLATIRKAGNLRSLLLEAPQQYSGVSDDDLMSQAQARYESEANTAKNLAQSLYNQNVQALGHQRAQLDQPYAQRVAAAQKATAQNVDSLQGSMLSRGLGRSSYAGGLQQATLQAGANAVGGIMDEKGQRVNELNERIGTLGTNLGTALNTIEGNRDSSVRSAFDALKQQDYEKGLTSADARTNFLFNVLNQKKKVSSGGSSGSSGSRSSTSGSGSTKTDTGGFNIFEYLSGLLG